MRISRLRVDCGNNGKAIVDIQVECHSVEDVDDLIAWLDLAKVIMGGWENIYENAKASRPTKAATGENENPQPREVQSKSQVA